MRNSLDAWLINEIRTELRSEIHRGPSPIFSVARAIIEREPARADQWRLEKMARLVSREMAAVAVPAGRSSYMDYLPGMDLTDQLPLKKGSLPLGQATIQKLKESVVALRAAHKKRIEVRLDRRLGRIRRLIVEMAPYAREHHGLTVADYCELRAHGVEAGAKVRVGKAGA
jgi:hypothetical protein